MTSQFKRTTLLTIIAFMGFFFSYKVFAADVHVVIQGNERVEKETILSYMQLDLFSRVDDDVLNLALKNLYASKLFSYVSVRHRGGVVYVTVKENAIINEVAFEGNNHFDDETLAIDVGLRPRSLVDKQAILQASQRIKDIYIKSGYYAVRVNPKQIKRDQNRVDIVFEIEEGERAYIEHIIFKGNKIYNDSKLKSVIASREDAWYRFLSSSSIFDANRLSLDEKLLMDFYLSRGYLDVQVHAKLGEVRPKDARVTVYFNVEEGRHYKVGQVKIDKNEFKAKKGYVFPTLSTYSNYGFDIRTVRKDMNALLKFMNEQGYPFAVVNPVFDKNSDTGIVDITYSITQGKKGYIDVINITGNDRTLDHVIRREMLFVEGDAYSKYLLEESIRRIRRLGYFEQVAPQIVPLDDPSRLQLDIQVSEQPTGKINLMLGIASIQGIVGKFHLSESNLWGTGRTVSIDLSADQKGQKAELKFIEPYLFGYPISGGISTFFHRANFKKETNTKTNKFGLRLFSGYEIVPDLTQNWTYSLNFSDFVKNNQTAAFVLDDPEDAVRSLIKQTLTFDRLDNGVDPKDGLVLRLITEYCGLGGDVFYAKTETRNSYFKSFFDQGLVFKVSANAGVIKGIKYKDNKGKFIKNATLLDDRFSLGGQTFRGFDLDGIGPRSKVDSNGDPVKKLNEGKAVRGEIYAKGTIEANFDIGLPESFGMRGLAFMDMGTLTLIEKQNDVFDEASLRLSIGAGIRWQSPFGLVSVFYAEPLLKEEFDRERKFGFSFGTQF